MKDLMKTLIILGAISLWLGAMGGCDKKQDSEEVNSSVNGVEGKYYNKDLPEAYIELKADGTVFGGEVGYSGEQLGEWKVYGREIAVISVRGDVKRGKIEGDMILMAGEVWDRNIKPQITSQSSYSSPRIEKARFTTTKANLKILHDVVYQFRMDTGRYPKENIGLIELVKQPPDVTNWPQGGYLENKKLPPDGWGNPFIYEYPPGKRPFRIRSAGPDGEKGTEDDLFSTDL